MIGGYDPERGANVVGHRGYYLTGPGLALNQALIAYGLSFLKKREYKLVQTPYMMRKDVMAKVAQLSEFDEALYKVRPHIFILLTLSKLSLANAFAFLQGMASSPDESEAFD
jgi:seryl-tRNA synthetase